MKRSDKFLITFILASILIGSLIGLKPKNKKESSTQLKPVTLTVLKPHEKQTREKPKLTSLKPEIKPKQKIKKRTWKGHIEGTIEAKVGGKFEKVPKATGADLAMQLEFEKTRDPKLNIIPRERLYKAYKYMKQLEQLQATQKTTAAIPGISWQERGPNNQGGRTRAFIIDPNDPTHNSAFAASVSGGIWHTTNLWAANPNWQSVDDFMANLAVTTIAYDPNNPQIMYAGTGEGWYNTDAVRGAGIFKSTDGGNTWTQLANTNNPNFGYVQKVVVTGNGTVLAATRRSTTAGASGVYRSIDGGNTWTRVLAGVAADIEIAANGDIYASIGIWGNSDGVYKSTNDGQTWTRVFDGTTNGDERIEIACAPSNSNVIYIMSSSGANLNGIYRSTNAGASWTNLTGNLPTWSDCGNPNGTDFTRGQAWYDLILAVDPLDPNTVWAGGVDLMRTTNGGNSWTQVSDWCTDIHADHHAIWYIPGQSDTILFGNDGGVYVSTNATAASPTYIVKNGEYRTLQLYSCAIYPTAGSNYALGGAQDNGSHQWTVAGLGPTTRVTGGDGAFCHIDQDQPQYQWTSYVYNNYFRSTDGGVTWTRITIANTGRFINPTDYDNSANILYAAYDNGRYLRWENPQTGTTTNLINAGFNGTVTAVTVDENIANRVWFGSYDRNTGNWGIYIVDNANATPTVTDVTDPSMPTSAYVSCIAIDPNNSNHVIVTFSNYGVASVWRTTDGGTTWTNVEGNLPDMPVRWALISPNNPTQVMLATELGVWSTSDVTAAAVDWQPSNIGLANVRTDMFQLRASDKLVIAATHGRGLFESRVFMQNFAEFQTSTTNLNEKDATTSFPATDPKNCMKYIDVQVPIKINRAPDADATIDITIDATSTAIQNKDYELLTPTITIPATTTNLVYYATVRVYDDPYEENKFTPETIVLNMTVTNSGTSNLLDGTNLTHTIYISDNDYPPTLAVLNTSSKIGAGTTSSEFRSPFRGNWEDERMQILITAAELTAAGINPNDNLTALGINILTKNSTNAFQGFTIKIAHTTLTSLPANFTNATFTTCYSGDYVTTTGWNIIQFNQNYFTWNGTDNLLVEFCYDNPNGSPPGGADLVEATSNGDGNNYTAYSRRNNDTGCSMVFNNGVDSWATNERVNVIFETRSPTAIQTTINTTTADSLYIAPNETIHFYDQSGNIIATIANSDYEFGCTKIFVDRAGTGATAFWNNNTANYLTDKTFLAYPASNSATASYDITLYYTNTEVTGWETATGNTWTVPPVKMVKSPYPISATTPSTPNPGGTNPTIINNPTLGTYGSDHTITATFSDGFSGFAAGDPGTAPLSITLLKFSGYNNGDHNLIQWTTGTEAIKPIFVLERRAKNETKFSEISSINARGGFSYGSNYSYKDYNIEPNTTYYYRLKTYDYEGKINYSPVIEISLKGKSITSIFPNPATNNLFIKTFASENETIEATIFDMSGKKVLSKQWNNLNSGQHLLNINTQNLESGTYIIVIKYQSSGKTVKSKITIAKN